MRFRFSGDPKDGETRVICKFLILPKCLPISDSSNQCEIRWLETALIQQKYFETSEGWDSHFCWQDMHWASNAAEVKEGVVK